MFASPSLLHVTEGFGSPLTSQVKIARSPIAKMVLFGRSLVTGLHVPERERESRRVRV